MKFLSPNWPAPSKIKAYTILRPAFAGHEPLPAYDLANRLDYIHLVNQVTHELALPAQPIWLTQVHGATTVEAITKHTHTNADASFSTAKQTVCAVITADCLPILICNQQGTEIAAIHAGWRGLSSGVLENTLAKMTSPPEECLVWLGPAIGPTKFEVGVDVYEAFIQHNSANAAAFTIHAPNKWLANLYELAKIRLNQLGIFAIYGGNFCTYTQEDLFYSYRRDQGKTGRMTSLIWIE